MWHYLQIRPGALASKHFDGIERNVEAAVTTQCHDDLSSFTSQSTQTVRKNAPVSGLSQQLVMHLFQKYMVS